MKTALQLYNHPLNVAPCRSCRYFHMHLHRIYCFWTGYIYIHFLKCKTCNNLKSFFLNVFLPHSTILPFKKEEKQTFLHESQHENKFSSFPYYFPMRKLFSTAFPEDKSCLFQMKSR